METNMIWNLIYDIKTSSKLHCMAKRYCRIFGYHKNTTAYSSPPIPTHTPTPTPPPPTPRQYGRRFTNDVFKCLFLNEKFGILIQISLQFVPNGPINNIPALVQIMAWRLPGDKPLSEPMLTQFTDAYMRHQERMSFNSMRPSDAYRR